MKSVILQKSYCLQYEYIRSKWSESLPRNPKVVSRFIMEKFHDKSNNNQSQHDRKSSMQGEGTQGDSASSRAQPGGSSKDIEGRVDDSDSAAGVAPAEMGGDNQSEAVANLTIELVGLYKVLGTVVSAVGDLGGKLDSIREGFTRFRPDAVWTFKEAAKELRKSEGKLLECVNKGDIKTCPRKEGEGGQRGARGEPILFLYEEIQRFKGYRK